MHIQHRNQKVFKRITCNIIFSCLMSISGLLRFVTFFGSLLQPPPLLRHHALSHDRQVIGVWTCAIPYLRCSSPTVERQWHLVPKKSKQHVLLAQRVGVGTHCLSYSFLCFEQWRKLGTRNKEILILITLQALILFLWARVTLNIRNIQWGLCIMLNTTLEFQQLNVFKVIMETSNMCIFLE